MSGILCCDSEVTKEYAIVVDVVIHYIPTHLFTNATGSFMILDAIYTKK